jgi:organic hydroperoxide reductase OsmC/OhrA
MKTQEQTTLTTYPDRITNTLYSTKVTATGGRHGQIRSEDGLLDMKLALPRQLGGREMPPTRSSSLPAAMPPVLN